MSRRNNINTMNIAQGLEAFKKTPGAVLLDVRTPEEFKSGRLAGSKNIPLQQAAKVFKEIPEKDTPIFIYCLSGGRSRIMASFLKREGYEEIIDIGGINAYGGGLEAE